MSIKFENTFDESKMEYVALVAAAVRRYEAHSNGGTQPTLTRLDQHVNYLLELGLRYYQSTGRLAADLIKEIPF